MDIIGFEKNICSEEHGVNGEMTLGKYKVLAENESSLPGIWNTYLGSKASEIMVRCNQAFGDTSLSSSSLPLRG